MQNILTILIKYFIVPINKFCLQFHYNLKHQYNAYWKIKNNKQEGPFCSTCFDKDGKLIHLIKNSDILYHCGVCDKNVIIE